MADLRKIKDKAAEAAAKGKLDKAARLYREALEGDPKDLATLQKLAEVLRRAGQTDDAIATYREVADRFGRDGLLIKAIAISKTILELDPGHVETQASLAGLYARRAAAEKGRPPVRGTLMMAAAVPSSAQAPAGGAIVPPPPSPAYDEDGVVSLRLASPPASGSTRPPPLPPRPVDDISLAVAGVSSADDQPPSPEGAPLDIVVEEAPRPAATRPAPRAAAVTAFGEIVDVADAALDAGVEVEIDFEPEPVDLPGFNEALDPFVPPPAADSLAPPVEVAAPFVPPEVTAPPPPAPPASSSLSSGAPQAAAASTAGAPPSPPSELPRFPIFSDLSPDAFVALTRGMVLHRVSPGSTVIAEGETGTSFFVVATGRLAVTRRDDQGAQVVLARIGEGDFFGEMAMLSGTARTATVTAEDECEVLELRADVLAGIAGRHPHLAESLRRFYRQRLLANAMAVSAIFRPLARGDRKLIMARFRTRDVQVGEVVIREGEPSDGLYVVLDGAVDVVKLTAAGETTLARLREGDVFGEMSCLRKAPASASVVVARAGSLLRLPRKDFDWLVVTYPQVLEHVAELSEERMENLDAIVSGRAQWTEEGLVLV